MTTLTIYALARSVVLWPSPPLTCTNWTRGVAYPPPSTAVSLESDRACYRGYAHLDQKSTSHLCHYYLIVHAYLWRVGCGIGDEERQGGGGVLKFDKITNWNQVIVVNSPCNSNRRKIWDNNVEIRSGMVSRFQTWSDLRRVGGPVDVSRNHDYLSPKWGFEHVPLHAFGHLRWMIIFPWETT